MVDPGQTLLRIDSFLHGKLSHVSRTKLQEGIEQGRVLVNGQPVRPNYKVKPGDRIEMFVPRARESTEIIAEDIPLNVVYEDEWLMILYKPAGMVVHPGHNNWSGTLVNALVHRFQELPTHRNGEEKPGLVHRIDKDTTGLMVIAKTDEAMTKIARQFADHSIERTYYAFVWGEPKDEQGTITGHLGRSPQDRRMQTVYPDGDQGKHAVTHYKVLKRFRYTSLVQCNLETGRTHQIRAHMRYIGHPLFNDEMYGGHEILKGERFSAYKAFVENCFREFPRHALHAKTLGFVHPGSGEWIQFDSELPADFVHLLSRWEQYTQTR